MKVRYLPGRDSYKTLTTNALRSGFLVDDAFKNGEINLNYTDADRAITGAAIPITGNLELKGDKKSMAAENFCDRRETGIINVGSKGQVTVDGETYDLDFKDALYIGRGAKKVEFSSIDGNNPAKFYILSYPAHSAYPHKLVKFADGEKAELGTKRAANKRMITKLIFPGSLKSCQLVMGITEIQEGSVWNTMGAHTHPRRTEIYTYFNMQEDDRLFHIFGEPDETRHIVVKDLESVISPSWSMHSGASTGNYSFIWGMGGENQDFDDMDFIPMDQLR